MPVVGEAVVKTADEATRAARSFGGKVVLKILSSTITHKSDVGGVAINLDADTIGERLQSMQVAVKAKTGIVPDAFLVQEMVAPGGLELILGCHRDPLGSVLLLGMGGLTAELMNDTCVRLLPPGGVLSRADALSAVKGLRCWPLLDGYRGRPKLDVDALVTAIVDFCAMVSQLGGRLVEAEINPIFVLPQGTGVRAADAVAVLAAPVLGLQHEEGAIRRQHGPTP